MSKEIELKITIDANGKVFVEPKGTKGEECLEIMKFLDKIEGFEVLETTPNKDMKKSNFVSNEWESYLSADYIKD
jgi:hypothetical protein